MNIKSKLIKEKQLTDRPIQTFKNTQPFINRLESEYLFNQPNQRTDRNSENKFREKENFNMVNSKPLPSQYISHNVIQIDNYEDKKFKTQQGFEPMMTKSRFMGEQEQSFESSAVYKTSENIVFRKDKSRKTEERMYDSVDQIQNERPLTFGIARKVEPLKNSVEYREDIKMKNEILHEINLGKSQQSLLASKDFSSSGFGDIARCINHNNKKAKYRLIADLETKDEELIYCSKCAINLLQQGFKVEEIKIDVPLTCKLAKSQQNFVNYNSMMNSVGGSSTRLQEMRNFEQKLNETEKKVSEALQRSACETQNIEELERQSWETQQIFDEMINHLQKEKEEKLEELKDSKNKRISELKRNEEQLKEELESVYEMKKEMKEFRNKFIIMKESEFRFLINSFQNKILNYGSYFQQNEVPSHKIEHNFNQIIIRLSEFIKNFNLDQPENEVRSSLTGTEKQRTNDEFICREIKGPFRTLFPEEESNQSDWKENEEDSPSFSKCHNDTFETMQRSLQNSQEFRF